MPHRRSAPLSAIAAALRPDLILAGNPITLVEPTQPERWPVVLDPAYGNYPYLAVSFENCLRALGRPQSDLANWLFPLLEPGQDMRASCDYVIFCDVGGEIRVLLVELKGEHREEADEQLANTRILIDWLLDTVAFHAGHVPALARDRSARAYTGVIFKISKGNQRRQANGLSWVRHEKMRDLPLTTRPYQQWRLADLVNPVEISDPVP